MENNYTQLSFCLQYNLKIYAEPMKDWGRTKLTSFQNPFLVRDDLYFKNI